MAHYILDENKKVLPADNVSEWSRFFEDINNRRVARTIYKDYEVSTVFLGLDHSFGNKPPVVFETMIFKGGSSSELYCQRYSTWEEAEKGHFETVKLLKEGKIDGEE